MGSDGSINRELALDIKLFGQDVLCTAAQLQITGVESYFIGDVHRCIRCCVNEHQICVSRIQQHGTITNNASLGRTGVLHPSVRLSVMRDTTTESQGERSSGIQHNVAFKTRSITQEGELAIRTCTSLPDKAITGELTGEYLMITAVAIRNDQPLGAITTGLANLHWAVHNLHKVIRPRKILSVRSIIVGKNQLVVFRIGSQVYVSLRRAGEHLLAEPNIRQRRTHHRDQILIRKGRSRGESRQIANFATEQVSIIPLIS